MSDPLSASQKNPEPSINKPRHPLERPLKEQPIQRVTRQENTPKVSVKPVGSPIATYVFLEINILIFLADAFFFGGILRYVGGLENHLMVSGQYWRIFTSIFVHFDITHIAMNSISLFYLGRLVESLYGARRFLAIYLLSGIAGSLAYFALSSGLGAGASGAIFGLIGATAIFLYRNRTLLNSQEAIRHIVITLMIQIAGGLIGGVVSNEAHIGGLLGGISLSWFMSPLIKVEPDYGNGVLVKDAASPQTIWLAAVMGALIAAGAITLLVVLHRVGILQVVPLLGS